MVYIYIYIYIYINILSTLQKKILSSKIIELSSYTLSRSQLSLLNRKPKFTSTRKSSHSYFKDYFKKFTKHLQIKEVFKNTPFEDNLLVYNPSTKHVRTNNSNLQQLITEIEDVDQNYKIFTENLTK